MVSSSAASSGDKRPSPFRRGTLTGVQVDQEHRKEPTGQNNCSRDIRSFLHDIVSNCCMILRVEKHDQVSKADRPPAEALRRTRTAAGPGTVRTGHVGELLLSALRRAAPGGV